MVVTVGNQNAWGCDCALGLEASLAAGLHTFPLWLLKPPTPSPSVGPALDRVYICSYHVHVDIVAQVNALPAPSYFSFFLGVHKSRYDSRTGTFNVLDPHSIADAQRTDWHNLVTRAFWLENAEFLGSSSVLVSGSHRSHLATYDWDIHLDEWFEVGDGIILELYLCGPNIGTVGSLMYNSRFAIKAAV